MFVTPILLSWATWISLWDRSQQQSKRPGSMEYDPRLGFPYARSTVAPGPSAKTLIDGTYAAFVGGVGGYVFINDLVYWS